MTNKMLVGNSLLPMYTICIGLNSQINPWTCIILQELVGHTYDGGFASMINSKGFSEI